MAELNFVNDPVNPNYVIIVKLNAVDEAFANVKKTLVQGRMDSTVYTKLAGEIIYLWQHLKPIVRDVKSRMEKKVDDYDIDEISEILDSDRLPTYQEIKQIVNFFHDICYYGNITKPRAFFKIDYSQTNAIRGLKNGTVLE